MIIFESKDLCRAAELLQRGEIIAFPTETVYGLGAPIFNEEAVQKIFKAKGRPSDNPLIAHISSMQQIDQIAVEVPKIFYTLANLFFPGPLTLVVKKHPLVPRVVSAGLDTIAIRMPSHPIAQSLIQQVGQPIVAPSANLSGRPSSTTYEHVREDFNGKIAGVIAAEPSAIGIESTVVSLLSDVPILLRPGHVTKDQIEVALGGNIQVATSKIHRGPVQSPGMKYRHYAPKASVRLFYDQQKALNYIATNHTARMILSSQSLGEALVPVFPLTKKNFYSLLREADHREVEEVIILLDEATLRDEGLINRVLRSAEPI
ncbi:MAG: threonylcarbamoyl-AMP synthase [Chlamydiae bacterium]|nr:threonylcarbamoyl-AMP synthase [Chlamydiota bacterium]